jgi:hypothetical protein
LQPQEDLSLEASESLAVDLDEEDCDSPVIDSPMPGTSASSSRPSSSELGESAKKKPRRCSITSIDSLDSNNFKDALLTYAEARAELRKEKTKEPEKNSLPVHVQAYGQSLLQRLSLIKGKNFYAVCKQLDDIVLHEIMYGECAEAIDEHLN